MERSALLSHPPSSDSDTDDGEQVSRSQTCPSPAWPGTAETREPESPSPLQQEWLSILEQRPVVEGCVDMVHRNWLLSFYKFKTNHIYMSVHGIHLKNWNSYIYIYTYINNFIHFWLSEFHVIIWSEKWIIIINSSILYTLWKQTSLLPVFNPFKDPAAVLGRPVCQQWKPRCCTSCTVNASFFLFFLKKTLSIHIVYFWFQTTLCGNLSLSSALSLLLCFSFLHSDPACGSFMETLGITRGVMEVWTLSSQRSVK